MKAPCKDCQSRTEDCHKDCDRYGVYYKENQQRNKLRYMENQFYGDTNDAINRMRRLRATNGVVSGGKRGRA